MQDDLINRRREDGGRRQDWKCRRKADAANRWGGAERREEQEKRESESAWMLSAAAEWHFIGICQLSSDWPDIANPPRCSALTDECVTVLCGRKQRGGSDGAAAGGPRVNRASQGPLSEGFGEIWRTGWSDIRELGGEEQIVSTIWDRGCTCDFPSPPASIYILEMFVCTCGEMSGSGYSYNKPGRNVLKTAE